MFDRVLNTPLILYCDQKPRKNRNSFLVKLWAYSYNFIKNWTPVYVFLKVLEHKCTCYFCRHALGRGMESDFNYSHFLGLGSTGMLLNKRVIRNIAHVLFECLKQLVIRNPYRNVYLKMYFLVLTGTTIIYKIWC